MDILQRIKQLVLHDQLIFTFKARVEMDVEGITDDDVVEAIINAPRVDKILRSTSPNRSQRRERLYVIKGMTFGGMVLYTKGAIRSSLDGDSLYILISSKRAQ